MNRPANRAVTPREPWHGSHGAITGAFHQNLVSFLLSPVQSRGSRGPRYANGMVSGNRTLGFVISRRFLAAAKALLLRTLPWIRCRGRKHRRQNRLRIDGHTPGLLEAARRPAGCIARNQNDGCQKYARPGEVKSTQVADAHMNLHIVRRGRACWGRREEPSDWDYRFEMMQAGAPDKTMTN